MLEELVPQFLLLSMIYGILTPVPPLPLERGRDSGVEELILQFLALFMIYGVVCMARSSTPTASPSRGVHVEGGVSAPSCYHCL